MMENFDKKIKESLEQHELPLDPQAWAGMEAALDKAMPVSGGLSTGSNWGWYAAGVTLVVAGGIALFSALSVNKDNIGESMQSTQGAFELEITSKEPIAEKESLTREEMPETVAKPTNEASSESTDPETANELEPKSVSTSNTENTIANIEEEGIAKSSQPLAKPDYDNKQGESEAQLLLGFTPSAMEVCAGETVSFLNNTFEKNVDFAWSFGDGHSSVESDPNHTFYSPGTYHVSLIGTRKGSDVSSEQSITIKVNRSPETEIFHEAQGPIENLVTYNCNLLNGETAEWKFDDGMTAKGATATHLYRNAGPKMVNLTVKNELGCVYRTSVSENVTQNLEFFAGSAFTANGDMNNDVYFIKILRELKIPFTFVIRDANNREVYSTTDPMDGWNGKLNNTGPDLPEGKYSWRVILDSKYLKDNQKTGTVILTRN